MIYSINLDSSWEDCGHRRVPEKCQTCEVNRLKTQARRLTGALMYIQALVDEVDKTHVQKRIYEVAENILNQEGVKG